MERTSSKRRSKGRCRLLIRLCPIVLPLILKIVPLEKILTCTMYNNEWRGRKIGQGGTLPMLDYKSHHQMAAVDGGDWEAAATHSLCQTALHSAQLSSVLIIGSMTLTEHYNTVCSISTSANHVSFEIKYVYVEKTLNVESS